MSDGGLSLHLRIVSFSVSLLTWFFTKSTQTGMSPSVTISISIAVQKLALAASAVSSSFLRALSAMTRNVPTHLLSGRTGRTRRLPSCGEMLLRGVALLDLGERLLRELLLGASVLRPSIMDLKSLRASLIGEICNSICC